MKLKDLKPNTVIKLGTHYGAGFIYAGKVRDMDEYDLGVMLKKYERKLLVNTVGQMYTLDPKAVNKTAKTIETMFSFISFIPPFEREVVEMYPSELEKGVKIVIIEGFANGNITAVDETPKPITADMLGYEECIALLAAIWRNEVDILVDAYEKMLIGKKQAQEAAVHTALAQERILNGATGIIRKARQIATNNVCFDEMGHMIRNPKRTYESLCKRMEIIHEHEQAAEKETGKVASSRGKVLQGASGTAECPGGRSTGADTDSSGAIPV